MISKYFKTLLKSTRKSQKFIDFINIAGDGYRDHIVGVEAYRKNVIVYRCVNIIAQSASHVP